MRASRFTSIGLTAIVLSTSAWMATPAQAATCTTANLINGSFEDYTLDTAPFASMFEATVVGNWMNDWGTPLHFLFLDLDESPQDLPGWETTNTDNIVELQRQVEGYEQDGTQAGGGYFDNYAVQPADGEVWGELNSTQEAALYQDVELDAGVEYTWSIKHHGRVFETEDEMKVLIGPAGGSLTQQTSFQRFAPTNANLFSGTPTYNDTSTTMPFIRGTITDGWVMYRSTFTPDTTGTYRFQFEAVAGLGQTVSNLLDDIEFTRTECISSPSGEGSNESGGGGESGGNATGALADTGPSGVLATALGALTAIGVGAFAATRRRRVRR